jgi:nitroreductase
MNSTYYEAIFKRKSVRKFDLTPFDEGLLREIAAYTDTIQLMFEGIKVEFKLLPGNLVRNLFPVKAPHYIVIFSEDKDGYLTNAGFMMQQLDLYLSKSGIGSCWMGMAKPVKEILEKSELEFVTALLFGKAKVPLHRHSISEFKRKPMDSITNITNMDDLLEAVRLAPSATNSQPWYFTTSDGYIHAHCVRSGPVKGLIYNKLNKIDLGIAICHLWTAAIHFGRNIQFITDEKFRNSAPAGYYYIASLKIYGH